MTSFTYNDMVFSVDAAQSGCTIRYVAADGKTGVVGAGLFAGVPAGEIEARAKALVKTIFPVGIRCVGPDVVHPIMIGDLKIVPPDVTHPNFIYWDKESASFPKQS